MSARRPLIGRSLRACRTLRVAIAVGFVVSLIATHRACAEEPQPIAVEAVQHEGRVDFQREILPFLRSSCLACHNARDAESELVLETPQTIAQGGAEGPAVVAGQGEESRLLQLAAHRSEPVMPPVENDRGAKRLTPRQLGLLKLWIDQGASGEVTTAAVAWQPLPPGLNPIYAVAVTPDGQYAACGRANQLFLYHLPTGRLVTRLTDPALLQAGITTRPGVAHLDMVQSLAFDPSGELLASGGFRTVKLWRRPRPARIGELLAGGPPRALAISADGRLAASGNAAGEIKLFETDPAREVRTLSGHTAEVRGLAFSPDGARLYSVSLDKTLRAWNVADGAALHQLVLPAPAESLLAVDGGKLLVTGGADNVIRVWDAGLLAKGDEMEPASSAEEKPAGEQPAGETAASDKPPAEKPAAEKAAAGKPPQPKPLRELKGHGGPVVALAPVPARPRQFISGSGDGTLRHWDAGDGRQIRQFNHGGPVVAVAARPDGQRFASVATNARVKLWDATNGQQQAELKGDHRAVFRVAELDRALALAKGRAVDRKNEVDAAEKRLKSEQEAQKKANEAKPKADKELADKMEAAKQPAAARAEAEQQAAAAEAALVKAGEEKTKAEQQAAAASENLKKAEAALRAANEALAKDNQNAQLKQQRDAAQQALTAARQQKGEADRAVQVAVRGRQEAERKRNEANKRKEEATVKAAEAERVVKQAESARAAADRAVAAAGEAVRVATEKVPVAKEAQTRADAEVQRLDDERKQAGAALAAAEKPCRGVAFSPDGLQLAVTGDDGLVHLYDAARGTPLEVLEAGSPGRQLVFIDAIRLLAAAEDGKLALWKTRGQWKLERTIGQPADAVTLADRVLALDFSPDGKLLATGGGQPSRGGELKLFQVTDGKLVRELAGAHSDALFGLEFSPAGDTIASASADRFMKVHRVADGQHVRSFEGHTHHVLDVSWQANGKRLATAGADNVIKVWDAASGAQQRTVTGFSKEVTAIEFVGIGENALCGAADRSVRLVRTSNGQTARSFGGGRDYMLAVAATRDGKTIVAGGQESVLRVWNAADGKPLQTLEPPKPAVEDKQASSGP